MIPYERPLANPIQTAHGRYELRKGFILVLVDEEGVLCLGDAAPLPGVSSDGIEQSRRAFKALERLLKEGRFNTVTDLDQSPLGGVDDSGFDAHAFWFALATALADWKSKRQSMPLSQTLAVNGARLVQVNGLISEGDAPDCASRAGQLSENGFQVLKMKVGVVQPRQDTERILAVCEAAPRCKLRLDANCAWDFTSAKYVLSQIPRESIDFVEEPLRRDDGRHLLRLREESGLRIALDESVSTLSELTTYVAAGVSDVVVIKPMVLGRLYQCHLLACRAIDAGTEVVYTSCWESDIGIAATLHLAAALGPNPPAMGLSTAGMIAEGIVKSPLKIENGYLKVPEGPGLGLELAPDLLAKLR